MLNNNGRYHRSRPLPGIPGQNRVFFLLAERDDGDGEEDEDDRANYNSDYDSDDIYGDSSYLGDEEGCD